VRVFVDTSALLAVLDADDRGHSTVARAWKALLGDMNELVTSSYVLVETFALVQSRLGVDATRALDQDLLPALGVIWLDDEVHRAAVSALLTAGRRQLSLVDCASFEAMRRHGITTAFTLDSHFAEQGFEVVPVAP
jgi:predicted nucleic acid-binding protein